MHGFGVIVVWLGLLAAGFGRPALAALVFEKETIETTGVAGEDVIEAEFRFLNDGKEPVVVTDVASSCGCTVPELSKKDYAPGERGKLTARFTVGDRQGRQVKTITVRTNENSYALNLVATLPVRFKATPRLVVFRPGDTGAKVVRIGFEADGPVTLEGVESLHPGFKVEVSVIREGVDYELKVTPAGGLERAERANIRVRTKGVSGREYTDMVYARFAP